MQEPILEIEDLKTHFFTYNGVVRAVDGIDLTVNRNEVVGIVGETGCGKSVTVRSTMGLVPDPGRIVAGRVLLDGENLLAKERCRAAANPRQPDVDDISKPVVFAEPGVHHRQSGGPCDQHSPE